MAKNFCTQIKLRNHTSLHLLNSGYIAFLFGHFSSTSSSCPPQHANKHRQLNYVLSRHISSTLVGRHTTADSGAQTDWHRWFFAQIAIQLMSFLAAHACERDVCVFSQIETKNNAYTHCVRCIKQFAIKTRPSFQSNDLPFTCTPFTNCYEILNIVMFDFYYHTVLKIIFNGSYRVFTMCFLLNDQIWRVYSCSIWGCVTSKELWLLNVTHRFNRMLTVLTFFINLYIREFDKCL